jgi:hypothetical protein
LIFLDKIEDIIIIEDNGISVKPVEEVFVLVIDFF